jgi:hypothetical protein
MDTKALVTRSEEHIRSHALIPPGGEVLCLVSGGADSTALWHVLRTLGYDVTALHVNHHLRGEESDEDARFCAERLGAEVVDTPPAKTEAELRDLRYSYASDRLRATGHTASDQVETVLYRLVSSGKPGGIKPKREDGVVRPSRRDPVPRRLLQPRDEARPRPRADRPAPPAARQARGEEPPRPRRGSPRPAGRAARELCRIGARRPRWGAPGGARI